MNLTGLWKSPGRAFWSLLIGLLLLGVTLSYASIVWSGLLWFGQDVLLPLVKGYFDLLNAHPFVVLSVTFLGIIVSGFLLREAFYGRDS